jgi:hypothetical protein
LFAALEQIEGDGQAGLTGGQGRLFVFQGPDFSDQTRTVQPRHRPGRPDGAQRPGRIHDRQPFRLGQFWLCLLWLGPFGHLIAVHKTTLSGTSDKKTPTDSP